MNLLIPTALAEDAATSTGTIVGNIFQAPTLYSETLATIGFFQIRNTLLMAWLAVLFLVIVAFAVQRTGHKLIPGKFQTLVEMLVGGLYDFFGSVVQDARQTSMFFPLVATIFIFLIAGNWMGIVPGIGSIFLKMTEDGKIVDVPLFRSMNADVNMTLAMALIAMIAVQYFGMRELGFGAYAGKFFVAPWKRPIDSFVGLLEIISELSKVISFTFRLFGNIFAGEVLLAVIAYLVPYLAPIPFLAMEIFVGLIQALVFSMLTTVFLKMAVTGHHDDHGDAQAEHAHA